MKRLVRRRRLGYSFFRVAPILALASGCGSGKSESRFYHDPFESSKMKVHLRQSDLIPGMSLAVMIDESCLSTRTEQALSSESHFLTRGIHMSSSNSSTRSPIQTYRVPLDQPISMTDLREMANSDPCIVGVGPNQIAFTEEVSQGDSTLEGFDDPLLPRETHLTAIHALESYPIFFHPTSGIRQEVIIAFVDTGIELTHPDLKPNLWINEKELNGKSGEDNDGDGYVNDVYGYNFASKIGDPSHETPNDHGSHVAGLAAAAGGNAMGILGVMGHKARIMALNVFGKNWGAETVDIDSAIRFAVDHGANVINLSIGGGGQSDTTAAAIVYALNHGVVVVTSAGNLRENIDSEFYFPASYAPDYPGLISVGANNAGDPAICDFSNYGPHVVKIAAPGCDQQAPQGGIYSTLSHGTYGFKKGTSMSAPIISGAAALAFGLIRERKHSAPTPAEIEDLLSRSGQYTEGLNGLIAGARRIDLKKLADEIDRSYPFKL